MLLVEHHVPGAKGRRRLIGSRVQETEVTEIIFATSARKANTSTSCDTLVFQVELKLPNYEDRTLPEALAARAYRRVL